MYPDRRSIFTFDIKTADMAGAPADNTDLFSILVPKGLEVEIQGFAAHVRLASDDLTDSIELVKEDNTILAVCLVGATGKISAKNATSTGAAVFPIRVAPQSTTGLSLLKLRTNGALDATTDATFQVSISGMGAAI